MIKENKRKEEDLKYSNQVRREKSRPSKKSEEIV